MSLKKQNFADENGTWSAKIELDRISAGLLDGSAMIEDASAVRSFAEL